MAGNRPIPAVHMGSRNDMLRRRDHFFHFSSPFAGVFTVCPDKFLNRKMLIGVVPVYKGCWVEIGTDRLRILPKDSILKFINIHRPFPLFFTVISRSEIVRFP